MQSEEDINHMAMPGGPGAVFIMIHSQLAFPLFKALLDGPSHHGGFAQFGKRDIDGRIGKGVFDLPIRSFSDKEPYRGLLRKSISGGIDPEARHLGDNRTLSAFGQNDRFPAVLGNAGNIGYGLRSEVDPATRRSLLGFGPRPE